MDFEKPDFKSLADNWPSTFVARERIEDFTGGILTSRYLANLDSQGKGPEGRVRVGRKIAYTVESVLRFLQSRSEMVERHQRS